MASPYSAEAWAELGRRVRTARRQAGLRDTTAWSDKVGRSSRMLLGLERGEKVGDETLERIEEALGWPQYESLKILGQRDSQRLHQGSVAHGTQIEPAVDVDVIAAIEADPALLPVAKAHLLAQYQLLLRIPDDTDPTPEGSKGFEVRRKSDVNTDRHQSDAG